MSITKRIAKNFFSLGITELVTRLVSTVITIYIARELGVDSFGQITFAVAFTAYFNLFADFGLTTLGIREIARKRINTNYIASNILILQLIIGTTLLVCMGLLLVFIPVDVISNDLKLLTFLFGISLIPGALSMAYVFDAHERMELTSLSRIVTQAVALPLTLLFVIWTKNVIVVPVVQFIAGLASVIFTFIVLRKLLNFVYEKWDFKYQKELFRSAVPFVLATLFTNIYNTFDILFIQFYLGVEQVGYYAAGFKIITLLLILPRFFQTAFYPAISHILHKNPLKVQALINRSFMILFIIGFPIALGGSVLGQQLLDLVFGNDYTQSVLSFRIAIWIIFFIFINVGLSTYLLANNQEKEYTKISFIGAILNVFSVIILVPLLGIVGAAIARVVTEIVILFLYYIHTKSFISLILERKLLTSVFLSAFVVLGLSEISVHIIYLVVIGLIAYGSLLFVFKVLNKDIIIEFLGNFKKE